MEIGLVGADMLLADRRTDMTKLMVAYCNFTIAPNTCHTISGKLIQWRTPNTSPLYMHSCCCPHHERLEVELRYCISHPALCGGKWSASRCGRFTPRRNSFTHWVVGWVSPRAGVGFLKKSNFVPLMGIEPRPLYRPAHNLVTILTELTRLLK